ncbi:MAG: hypothetical protein U1F76_17680 [Candidatus Competibacteraceae bacterium]
MKAPPEEVKLSREDGEALIGRSRASSLADDDHGLLIKLIRLYFWFTFALSETKISLKRLKRALVGGGKPPPPSPPPGGGASGSAGGGTADVSAERTALPPSRPDPARAPAPEAVARRQGHGRHGAGVDR